MLSSMRTAGNSIFMKLLMMLLVISFAVWGVGDIVRSGNNGHLVTVGDEIVTYPEYARAMSNTSRMLQEMGAANIPESAIQKQVLERLVEEKIVQQRMKQAGLEVNRDLLVKHLRAAPALQNEKGVFDAERFKLLLQNKQISEEGFLGELATDLRAQTFSASLGSDGLTPPEPVAKLYASVQNEKRDAVLFSIPASSVKAEAVDEAGMKSYYENNKGLLYMNPERRSLEYVTFSAKDVAARAAKDVTPQAVAERVASDPELYKDNEKQARAELLSEAQETVTDTITVAIEDALAAGDSMGEAVAAAGLSAQSRVLRDVSAEELAKSKDGLTQSVAEKGFGLLEGETSEIGTTADGAYYMVSAQSVTAAEAKPFDDVKNDVAKRANARAQSKALRAQADKLAVALADTKDWKKVAAEFGASARSVSNLKRGDKAPAPAALNEAIFEREIGGVAGPLVQDNSAELALVTAAHFGAAPEADDVKVRAMMGEGLQKELLGTYYGQLVREYPVHVNEGMMQQINAQNGDGA